MKCPWIRSAVFETKENEDCDLAKKRTSCAGRITLCQYPGLLLDYQRENSPVEEDPYEGLLISLEGAEREGQYKL